MKIYKAEIKKPDGRIWNQFSRTPFKFPCEPIDFGLLRPDSWQAPTLRHNEMRNEWTSYSVSRNNRPMLPPKEYCPLCPASISGEGGLVFQTEVPKLEQTFEWATFENMFPGLSLQNGIGRCEVILYSPNHDSTLGDETVEHISGLIQVWQDRSRNIGALPEIEFVFLFENKGTEVGVTLHHPHGQLYAFNHIPPFVAQEHLSAHHYFNKTNQCLVCAMRDKEKKDKIRIIEETDNIVAYVPFAARYPYEIHVTTQQHRPLIESLNSNEIDDLALVLKKIISRYDSLFGIKMPYLMVHHQSPAKAPNDLTYHWHIEFYPPYRAAHKLKYLAGVESGTGFFINDTLPEETAAHLRSMICNF